MSTSTRAGLTLGLPASAAAVGDQPVRTSTWRGIVDSINHVADERSRVLVSYPQRSTTTGGRLAGNKASLVNTWVRIYSFGPFALLVGPRGVPYPIRARVGGRAATVTDSCILRIGVCPWPGRGDGIMDAVGAGANIIETAAFTDVTNSWRAPTVADQLLVPGAEFTASSLTIVDALSSGSPGSISLVQGTVEIWSKCNTSNGVWCSQAYAAEQVAL
ncbi:MAG: hypothetical protein WC211_00890 [Dehalococcoidia bacterium]